VSVATQEAFGRMRLVPRGVAPNSVVYALPLALHFSFREHFAIVAGRSHG
jgi:hypothetical protein